MKCSLCDSIKKYQHRLKVSKSKCICKKYKETIANYPLLDNGSIQLKPEKNLIT